MGVSPSPTRSTCNSSPPASASWSLPSPSLPSPSLRFQRRSSSAIQDTVAQANEVSTCSGLSRVRSSHCDALSSSCGVGSGEGDEGMMHCTRGWSGRSPSCCKQSVNKVHACLSAACAFQCILFKVCRFVRFVQSVPHDGWREKHVQAHCPLWPPPCRSRRSRSHWLG